ncbi:MAG: TlpA family protein disulfide reductase [Bryobacterales bacterium]|nr:TlpA family protein disulfide reductase [Bryobacterales bacterium]MBV9397691.1 TlpA family protein disulfide reductase [Bryobacterales bacterium]
MSKRFWLTAILIPLLAYAREPRPVSQVPIPLADGTKINLRQYQGKVVVLAIFSTTCPDCIENLQMLNRVQKDLGPQGFQAIGAAGDNDAQYQVGGFVQRYRIGFPVGFLTKDQMIAIGDIEKDRRPVAPIFLFIDKKSVVRNQFYGDSPIFKQAEKATRTLVQNLLREPAK